MWCALHSRWHTSSSATTRCRVRCACVRVSVRGVLYLPMYIAGFPSGWCHSSCIQRVGQRNQSHTVCVHTLPSLPIYSQHPLFLCSFHNSCWRAVWSTRLLGCGSVVCTYTSNPSGSCNAFRTCCRVGSLIALCICMRISFNGRETSNVNQSCTRLFSCSSSVVVCVHSYQP